MGVTGAVGAAGVAGAVGVVGAVGAVSAGRGDGALVRSGTQRHHEEGMTMGCWAVQALSSFCC